MNPLALLIGIPLGLWLSNAANKGPEIVEREKRRYASAMERRFGADQRKCKAYEQHQMRVELADKTRRDEFRKKQQKG